MPSATDWCKSHRQGTSAMCTETDSRCKTVCGAGFLACRGGRLESLPHFLRWPFVLLALVVPALVGYDVYFQWSTPVLDFTLDGHTGLVYEVPQETFADWAGLLPGDVILTVDGTPFAEWHDPSVGNYPMEIERDGRRLTLELPIVPLAKVNLLPLISAVVVVLTFWGAGTLLLLRRFRQKEVRLFFLLAQTIAVALLLPLAHPASWLIPRWMISLSVACFHLAAPFLLHHTLTFPVSLGTPLQRRWGLGLLYGLALVAVTGGLSRTGLGWRLSAFYTTLEFAVAITVLVYVYLRRATPDDRRRLRLVVFGTILAAIPPILFYFLPSIIRTPPPMPGWMVSLFLILIPLSYLYAIARHNLFGIDHLLNRALVYVFLSLGIFAIFLGPLLLIYRLLPGDVLFQTMIVAGLTLLVGLTFDRTRAQVQRLVDKIFYSGWYDYPGVVETVSGVLARCLEREQLAGVLTRQVPELMQLHPGHLWIGEPNQSPNLQSPISNLQFPLTFQGQVRGLWTVGPHRDGDDLNAADRRILETLARQAEVALGNVLLVEMLRRQLDEIRTIQRQLLRSREEERARLARDLHDRPIQTLVGLNMQLGLLLAELDKLATCPTLPVEALKDMRAELDKLATCPTLPVEALKDMRAELGKLATCPTPLAEALKSMRAEVRQLLGDLRQVCVELRPPMLDTLGLGAALRALAGDWSAQSGVEMRLDLPPDATLRPEPVEGLRSLPGEVSVNLYRVVQEALTNIARHAEARQVTIQLAWEDSRLILTVHDDGLGFVVPAAFQGLAAQGHFGLAGMQERVELIGGALTVESAPGRGTTVRVVKNMDLQD